MHPLSVVRPCCSILMLAVATLLTSACTTPMIKSTVVANEVQEQAYNKLLLLNIARAHEHMPMHFSQLTAIRSGPGGAGIGVPSLGLEIPFGGGSDSTYKLTPSLEGSSSVDVSPLYNQEFMRGMTSSVEPQMLLFFANQGWPASMLLYLFIESIDLAAGSTIVDRLPNDPFNKNFSKFQDFVNATSNCEFVADEELSYKYFTSTLEKVENIEGSAAAKTAGLTLVETDERGEPTKDVAKKVGFRLAAVSTDVVIHLRKTDREAGEMAVDCPFAPEYSSSGFIFDKKFDERKQSVSRVNTLQSRSLREKLVDNGKLQAQLKLRSPEAMIYYLGKVARFQNASWLNKENRSEEKFLKMPLTNGGDAIFFRMSNRGDIENPAISVKYMNQEFEVPTYEGNPSKQQDRSTSVLSLLTLIIGLQDKGLNPPSVSNVRVLR